jgi:hypothetical protein
MAWISANVRAPMTSTYRAVSGRGFQKVCGPAGHDHRTSGWYLVDVLADADRQHSLEHIPGFIFWMFMQRRLVEGFIPGAALRCPLGQHELGVGRGQDSSGKPLRSDLGCSHDPGLRSHQRVNPHHLLAIIR